MLPRRLVRVTLHSDMSDHWHGTVTRQTVAVGPARASRRRRASEQRVSVPGLVTVDRRLQNSESASVCRSPSRWTGSVRTSPKNPSDVLL
jgi:hypothetical protein